MFGIALVFTFNALVAIMQFVADEDTLQGLVFWTMGSPVRASWEKLGVLAVVFIAVLFARYEAPGNSRHYVWAKRGR